MVEINNSIFYFFYNLAQQYPLVREASLFFSYIFIYLIIIFLLFYILFISKKKFFDLSLFFMSTLSVWFVARTIKVITQINRPFLELGLNPLHIEKGFSFPSEHMAIFSTLAFCMFFLNKKVGYFLIFSAILIGLSRIFIGVHYPVDILAGFVLAYLVSYLWIKLFKKIK